MADEAEQWRQWLGKHGAALLLFARQWSCTIADAEDAVQSGFLRFWKTRQRARDGAAYLYACVRSAAIDQERSGRRQRAMQDADFESAFVLDGGSARSQRQGQIEAALQQLPADQREVVVMKIWGGLTFAQIGAAVGIPLHTAASRYRVALIRLADVLSEEITHG